MSESPPANSPANSPGSPVSGPSPALLLARGVCRTLDQLGYASLTVNRFVNELGDEFLAFPNHDPNRVAPQPDGRTLAV